MSTGGVQSELIRLLERVGRHLGLSTRAIDFARYCLRRTQDVAWDIRRQLEALVGAVKTGAQAVRISDRSAKNFRHKEYPTEYPADDESSDSRRDDGGEKGGGGRLLAPCWHQRCAVGRGVQDRWSLHGGAMRAGGRAQGRYSRQVEAPRSYFQAMTGRALSGRLAIGKSVFRLTHKDGRLHARRF